MAGSISILSIDGNKVALIRTVPLATAEALVSHVAGAPGGKLTDTGQTIDTGGGPAAVRASTTR
jgi:hypothetical protein